MTGASTTENFSSDVAKQWVGARKGRFKQAALGLLIAAGIAGAADYGHYYWTTGRFLISTDDAYVKADFTTVAPKVSGYIAEVQVVDNQPVKAGQALARIDQRDFRAALDQAKADVAAAQAAIANIDAQIALQQSVIDQARAQITAAAAALSFAAQDNTGFGTVQRAQQASAVLQEKQAASDEAKASLIAAEKKIGVLKTERRKAIAALARDEAAARQAELNLSYTVITAPVDGTVGARALRVGQFVQAGTQLMAVVPLHAVYAVANFKETQLTHVRAGQAVTVAVDGFPNIELHGHVDSLAPASGLEFALLPPDNATGNFTKIVQRIPVKITFDQDPLSGLLRPGMSVEPTIDTRTGDAELSRQSG
jgi:membrane fusion protein (multidrug efflux system)